MQALLEDGVSESDHSKMTVDVDDSLQHSRPHFDHGRATVSATTPALLIDTPMTSVGELIKSLSLHRQSGLNAETSGTRKYFSAYSAMDWISMAIAIK